MQNQHLEQCAFYTYKSITPLNIYNWMLQVNQCIPLEIKWCKIAKIYL